ncbi:predicted protein [Arabidopsis lyrata subsp. lyrata]|uniref:Predicted protein n=1 Tax=Arabidopsis lyrata subsp. lyrata TaxID=81972 RepID=D7KEQ9_ARALL|nr:predicted protein [Arabidopsis lyrata subsp. lyrata]
MQNSNAIMQSLTRSRPLELNRSEAQNPQLTKANQPTGDPPTREETANPDPPDLATASTPCTNTDTKPPPETTTRQFDAPRAGKTHRKPPQERNQNGTTTEPHHGRRERRQEKLTEAKEKSPLRRRKGMPERQNGKTI